LPAKANREVLDLKLRHLTFTSEINLRA